MMMRGMSRSHFMNEIFSDISNTVARLHGSSLNNKAWGPHVRILDMLDLLLLQWTRILMAQTCLGTPVFAALRET